MQQFGENIKYKRATNLVWNKRKKESHTAANNWDKSMFKTTRIRKKRPVTGEILHLNEEVKKENLFLKIDPTMSAANYNLMPIILSLIKILYNHNMWYTIFFIKYLV